MLMGLAVGIPVGGFIRFKLHTCPDLAGFEQVSVLPRGERFTVTFSTESGAAARKLFENADGAGQGKIELYDGDQIRGSK